MVQIGSEGSFNALHLARIKGITPFIFIYISSSARNPGVKSSHIARCQEEKRERRYERQHQKGRKCNKHKHTKKSNKDGKKKRKEGRSKSKNKPVKLPSFSSCKNGEHQPNPEMPETIQQASLPSKGTSYMPSGRKELIH